MKFPGFVGPAYTLDSVNVDCQRAVNLYPELIESGDGKGGDQFYYRATPGLNPLITVGNGPIRLIHVDSIGRIFVVSESHLYRISNSDTFAFSLLFFATGNPVVVQSSGINTTTEVCTSVSHGMYTGLKVRVSSSVTLPTGLAVATDYYVILVDADNFKLASSLANAVANIPVNITAVGSGNMTVTCQIPGTVRNINIDDTLNYTNDTVTKASHGLWDGARVQVTAFGQPFIGGITAATDYYIVKVDANTFAFATSLANVLTATKVNLTAPAIGWNATKIKTSENAPTFDGTFSTTAGPMSAASMSFGGDGQDSSTMFTDGAQNYLLFDNLSASAANDGDFDRLFFSMAFNPVSLPAGPISSHIAWIDGYFILNEVGTNKFWISGLQDFNIDALNFSSSEGDPDVVMGLIANERTLCILNEETTEIYSDTGNSDFPFERIGGGFVEVGCLAKYSISKIDGNVLWLGRSKEGQGIVYSAKTLAPQRISTHAIEQAIAGYASPESAQAFCYQSKGHMFYVLNFDEATWVYDLSTGRWHERAYTNDGELERHRAGTHAFAKIEQLHIVGDYEDNRVYTLDDAIYTDDGDAITRLRSCPHLSAPDLTRVFCSRFQLDMETGIGLDGGVQGSAPTVMLDFSDDGGHTWSSELWTLADAEAGAIGEYKTRVMWRRLGAFRDRVFRVKITDPVKVVLIGASLDLEPGAN